MAVKLLSRQPVQGKVRCHLKPEACRCLSQVIQSLLRTRVTGARIAMAAHENRTLALFLDLDNSTELNVRMRGFGINATPCTCACSHMCVLTQKDANFRLIGFLQWSDGTVYYSLVNIWCDPQKIATKGFLLVFSTI